MTDPHPLPRRYQDAEVSRILERATELQRHGGATGLAGGGLTLQELEAIAREVGIDVQCLRTAAAELDAEPSAPSGWARAAGHALVISLDRTLPGQLDDAAFERLVVEIQRSTGELGQPSLMGRTLTWRADTPGNTRSLQIVMTSRDGETRIQIQERLNQLAGSLFGGFMGGVGGGVGFGLGIPVALGVLASATLAVAFPLGAIGAGYLTARTLFSTMAGRRRAALTELLDRLADTASEAIARQLEPRA